MEDLKHLVEQLADRRIDRRQFLRQALALGLSLPAASAILAACSPVPSPTPAPAKPAESKPAAPAPTQGAAAPKPAGKVDIAKLVDGAKKEGALVWIDVSVQKSNEEMFHNAFRKKYGLPDSFKIDHLLKQSGDVANTVEQETKAGNVTIDIVWVGNVPFFEALKKGGHLLPHDSDEVGAMAEMVKKLNFPTDPPNWFTAHTYGFVPVWNKKFIKKDFKSWADLLDPELKGKTIQIDIRNSSTATDTYIALRKVLPPDYYKRYKELTNPLLVARTPEQQQKVTTGERPLTNGTISGRAYQAWKEDKSLEFGVTFPSEGVVPLPISMAALAKAPHPNAARLFLEFLMSKEGQQIWLDYEVQWPLRGDVTFSPDLEKYLLPLDKVKLITVEWDKITDKARDEAKDDFRKTFGVD